MKVLFLDIDGVLNSHDWWMRRPKQDPPIRTGEHTRISEHQLDPVAVERLNRVIARTGAVICVSSTWRIGSEEHWRDTRFRLRHRDLKARIVGRTPNLSGRIPGGLLYSAVRRGLEIQAWLDKNPQVTRIAIVDDDSDMAHLMDRLVKTSMELGLLDEHVERLVAMLGEETGDQPTADNL